MIVFVFACKSLISHTLALQLVPTGWFYYAAVWQRHKTTAMLWSAEAGKLLATFAGHQKRVSSAVFSPDGSRIVTVSGDATAFLWEGLPTPERC
jgi:WD40 repeat protein